MRFSNFFSTIFLIKVLYICQSCFPRTSLNPNNDLNRKPRSKIKNLNKQISKETENENKKDNPNSSKNPDVSQDKINSKKNIKKHKIKIPTKKIIKKAPTPPTDKEIKRITNNDYLKINGIDHKLQTTDVDEFKAELEKLKKLKENLFTEKISKKYQDFLENQNYANCIAILKEVEMFNDFTINQYAIFKFYIKDNSKFDINAFTNLNLDSKKNELKNLILEIFKNEKIQNLTNSIDGSFKVFTSFPKRFDEVVTAISNSPVANVIIDTNYENLKKNINDYKTKIQNIVEFKIDAYNYIVNNLGLEDDFENNLNDICIKLKNIMKYFHYENNYYIRMISDMINNTNILTNKDYFQNEYKNQVLKPIKNDHFLLKKINKKDFKKLISLKIPNLTIEDNYLNAILKIEQFLNINPSKYSKAIKILNKNTPIKNLGDRLDEKNDTKGFTLDVFNKIIESIPDKAS